MAITAPDWALPPPSASDWSSSIPKLETDWSEYFAPPKQTTGQWSNPLIPPMYGGSGYKVPQTSYDPGQGGSYSPESSATGMIIAGEIDANNRLTHPENYTFNTEGLRGGVASVGTVGADPSFGDFYTTGDAANVDKWIQAAANKYGVPANFLKVIIQKESSGHFADGNVNLWWGRPDSGGLLPYIGVFQDTAYTRGLGQLYDMAAANPAGTQEIQIQLLARVLRSQYDEIHGRNANWGWINVAAFHYSGDPTGAYTPPDSIQYGTTQDYMAKTKAFWDQLDSYANANGAHNVWTNFTDTSSQTGIATPDTGRWQNVNQWDSLIGAISSKYGAPANLVKAIIMTESQGDRYANSPAGAVGLMQVMPFHVNGDAQSLLDPTINIDVGVRYLTDLYNTYGSWEAATRSYLSGNPYSNASDGNNTSTTYWAKVKGDWDELNAVGSGQFTGTPAPGDSGASTGGGVGTVFGGTVPAITQEFGPTDWSLGEGAWMYTYAKEYGVQGHTGVDYGVPFGTKIYSPISGTVAIIGSGFFNDVMHGGVGEIRIKLDNGDELIFGHMNTATLQVGQRVTPGMQVGTSGGENGDHTHLEYRTPNPSMPSGFLIVDPRAALGGAIGGVQYGSNIPGKTGLGYTTGLTYANILLAAASGQPLPYGTNGTYGGSGSGWNSWLLSAMNGTAQTYAPPESILNLNYSYNSGLQSGQLGSSTIGNGLGAANGAITNVSGSPVTSAGGQKLVSMAQQYVNVAPYFWGGTSPGGWDCSGFVWYLYKNALGKDIGTGSHGQFNGGSQVSRNQLQVGDLVFFDTAGGGEVDQGNTASHVGLYIGNGQMIHAANPGEGTIVSSINDPYYANSYLGARRY